MSTLRPKFVTFDCYGTLINFEMGPAARRVYGARLSPEVMDGFCESFRGFRLDEVLGAWKPFIEVVHNAVERSCKAWKIKFDPADAQAIYDEIPGWNPHPDVPAGLAKVAREIPLVILSNSMTDLIPHSVVNSAPPSMRPTQRRRQRPTSRACRPSNTCSTCWAADLKRSCTARPACATT